MTRPNKAIFGYVAAISGLAIVLLILGQDWSGFSAVLSAHWRGVLAILVLGLFSESLAVKMAGENTGGTFTITFIPLLATVVVFGPTSGTLFMAAIGAVAESLVRRKPAIKISFNVAQYVLATTIAGWAFLAWGVQPLTDSGLTSLDGAFALAFASYAIIFLGLNHVLVTGAIAFSQAESFRTVWVSVVGRSGQTIFYDLIIAPIALAVALLYQELGWSGFIVSLMPLYFIRHSYLTNYKLIQANRDLLKALVKAIETRDPYTSGHSVRVSDLARRIAIGMGIRSVEQIETAALLHDVGKIDVIYDAILRKPDSLSAEEREIIESHVTKGVQLLESLSSFPEEVVKAVRGHHERMDGKGYPDKLKGDQIVVGARIIKVCDAIDAMLSDRPYRKALSLDDVRSQLIQNAGTQFDATVVAIVVNSQILEGHAKELVASRGPIVPRRVPRRAADRGMSVIG